MHEINAKFYFIFRQKGEKLEGAAIGVSLSLDHALSETSARLVSKRNLEGNLPRKHALSA